jgi:hypothetical protein
VETIRLQTIQVLFFIELGTRRVHLADCTTNPDTVWVTRQARQRVWELDDSTQSMRFLIHDWDPNSLLASDRVFVSKGITIVRTPYQAPRANAFAERRVRSVHEVCLDPILILNENRLRCVLREYGESYNHARPHQGIGQRFLVSVSRPERSTIDPIRRRDVLGGVIHDYHRQPSAPVSGNG